MTDEADRISRGTGMLWLGAAAVAGLGAWVIFDAEPGINWLIWTLAASAGLLMFVRPSHRNAPTLLVTGLLAVLIAGGAGVTANEFMYGMIFLSVMGFLAMQMLLSANPEVRRITMFFAVLAPLVAFLNAVLHSLKRALNALRLVRSTKAQASVRGVVITLPIVIVFALLLSVADPTFASWREALADLVESWDFLPRTIFFLVLLTIVLGAWGYAAGDLGDATPSPLVVAPNPPRFLGSTERLILLGSVAGLFWLFLAVQLSYLFGNLPSVPGSGVTFADYAQRGFGELTVVATLTLLLIIATERYGRTNGRENLIRALTYAVLIAVAFLVASAFRRVVLYEGAYGFTTARLYAQAFMLVIATGLVTLAIEISAELDPGRLFRRIGVAAAVILLGLIYWNHEAWIAHRNIDRFATTGKLDTRYITRDLSVGAVPAIVKRLPSLPDSVRSDIQVRMNARYTGRKQLLEERWYEWNLGRAQGRDALIGLGVDLNAVPPVTR